MKYYGKLPKIEKIDHNKNINNLKKSIFRIEKEKSKINKKVFDIIIDFVYVPSFIWINLLAPDFLDPSFYFFIYLWLKINNINLKKDNIKKLDNKIMSIKRKIFNLKNEVLKNKTKLEQDMLFKKDIILQEKKRIVWIKNKEEQRAEIRKYKELLTKKEKTFFDSVQWKVNLNS